MWTVEREKTALEYADYIGDEDQSPTDRAADRAERFAGYRDSRREEAAEYADKFESLPAVHGYQSQARADRAAARHERIVVNACTQWEKAEYWQWRTAGVISHALHLCKPSVRMGRIKEIEANLRRHQKTIKHHNATIHTIAGGRSMSVTRLRALQAENDTAGAEMLIEGARFEAIKGARPRAVTAFNLFQTPVPVAAMMAARLREMVALTDRSRVLEPSAGLGRLYSALQNTGYTGLWVMVDNSPDCARELYNGIPANGKNLILQRDFLSVDTGQTGYIDAVIMNPPFSMGQDVRHILHARRLLLPGGALVALCYGGKKQETALKPLCKTWERLPENSFREAGTSADVILLTMEKPKNE